MKVSGSFRVIVAVLLGFSLAAGLGVYQIQRNQADEQSIAGEVSPPTVADMFAGFSGSNGLVLSPDGAQSLNFEKYLGVYDVKQNSPQTAGFLMAQVQEVLYANEFVLQDGQEYTRDSFAALDDLPVSFSDNRTYRNDLSACELELTYELYQQQSFGLSCQTIGEQLPL